MKIKMRIFKSEVDYDLYPFTPGVRVEAMVADGEEAIIDKRTNRKLGQVKFSFVVPTDNPEAYAYGQEFELEVG